MRSRRTSREQMLGNAGDGMGRDDERWWQRLGHERGADEEQAIVYKEGDDKDKVRGWDGKTRVQRRTV